ncbi:hypothetical protein F2Q68_00015149 [Brassica cretica]|uniref:Uncharacterized protein n=1 Tax=Brassica cretica TaxID=69181 RepID=A0A8S9HP89_BRACR|nr:hypothetical protein F2Q68_00015149 [Brassica cretica]
MLQPSSIATLRPSMYTAWSLHSDRAQAKLGRYVATEHAHGSALRSDRARTWLGTTEPGPQGKLGFPDFPPITEIDSANLVPTLQKVPIPRKSVDIHGSHELTNKLRVENMWVSSKVPHTQLDEQVLESCQASWIALLRLSKLFAAFRVSGKFSKSGIGPASGCLGQGSLSGTGAGLLVSNLLFVLLSSACKRSSQTRKDYRGSYVKWSLSIDRGASMSIDRT